MDATQNNICSASTVDIQIKIKNGSVNRGEQSGKESGSHRNRFEQGWNGKHADHAPVTCSGLGLAAVYSGKDVT